MFYEFYGEEKCIIDQQLSFGCVLQLHATALFCKKIYNWLFKLNDQPAQKSGKAFLQLDPALPWDHYGCGTYAIIRMANLRG